MALLEFNRNPTERQLRQFGMVCLLVLPLVGWLWRGGLATIFWLAGVGLLVAVLGMVQPRSLRPLFLLLSMFAAPLGFLVSEVVLVLIYFGLFLPLGLVFRWIGRDALQLKLDRSASTYWQAKKQPATAARYYRQS